MRRMLGVAALTLACAGALCSGCVNVTQQPAGTVPVVPTLRPIPTLTMVPTLSTGTAAPGVPTLPTLPTVPAASLPALATSMPAMPTVTVIFGSGADAGPHVATGDPNCSFGSVDAGSWGAAYGNISAGPNDLSEVQVTDEPDSTGTGNARIFSAFVVVGPLFGGRNYELSWDRFSDDKSVVYDVQDHGTSATIHFVGTSISSPLVVGGVKIDLTINCPTVTRS